MTAGIAHELTQPLTAIANYSESMLHRLKQDRLSLAESERMLELIRESSFRTSELIKRMRSLVRDAAADRKRMNLNDVIREVVSLLESDLRRSVITLQLQLDDQLDDVMGDPLQLQQVLLNLITNAKEAMVDTPTNERRLSIAARPQKDSIEVSVTDTGHGLLTNNTRRLFEHFYSTKQGGLGIGLRICQSIVNAHHGKKWTEKMEKVARRFDLRFRVHSRRRESMKATVNIVDDDQDVRISLEYLLEGTPYEVHAYSSAAEFLKAHNPDSTGCLLLDVLMPEMDGLELQRILNERKSTMPIIIMSGHADVPMAVRALESGAAGFLEKPFRRAELLQRIEDVIRQHMQDRQRQSDQSSDVKRLRLLSAREREVVQLMIDGLLSKQIAGRLGISEKTVEKHRANIRKKLGVGTMAEVVALAVRCELAGVD